ncbi:MAG: DUF433 domain-containing protein [Caulobacter sp.]|nr:DUF433 domain-containing protein [Caulobacter sp.]
MSDESVLGAFSEAQVERLTGVSIAQLRRWDRTGFFKAALHSDEVRAFSRVYSFKDLVSLRVLNQLRNVHNVSMPELRKTAREMAHLGDDVWTQTTLYVHRGRVVFDEPETSAKREVTTKQYVADIPLKVAISDTRLAIASMNRRDDGQIGRITRNRYVQQNKPVIAGTRIPVAAIKSFTQAGYSPAEIVDQYPSISVEDVRAAIEYEPSAA